MNLQPQVRKRNRKRLRYGDFVLLGNKVYFNSGAQFFGPLRLGCFEESTKFASIRTLVVIVHGCDH